MRSKGKGREYSLFGSPRSRQSNQKHGHVHQVARLDRAHSLEQVSRTGCFGETWRSHEFSQSGTKPSFFLQFLHVQERYLASEGLYSTLKQDDEPSDNYLQATLLPLASDRGVILFRKWIKRYSGGRFPFHGNATMSSVDVEKVFDIYNSHTKVSSYSASFFRHFRHPAYMQMTFDFL